MNRILIDFSALKSGGGCQLALNFITTINNSKQYNKKDLIFLLPDSGPLTNLDQKFEDFDFKKSPSTNPIQRFIFENFEINKFYSTKNITTIFSFFGTGLPHPKNIKSIVCVAYPVICYAESPFWDYLPFIKKIRLKTKNFLRVKRLSKANKILVETPIMLERVSQVLKRDKSDFNLLRPAPSEFINEQIRIYPKKLNKVKFLLLSGLAPHKNLWRLPELAKELKKYISEYEFIISAKENDFIKTLKDDLALSDYQNNKDHFNFVGTIYPNNIDDYYANADFLLSLSDLESFSNNYMEAWKSGISLIVSDRDFAKNICKNSALFIEPHEPGKAALAISNFIEFSDEINEKVARGKELLSLLPDTTERTRDILKSF